LGPGLPLFNLYSPSIGAVDTVYSKIIIIIMIIIIINKPWGCVRSWLRKVMNRAPPYH
jgi:hypothetical protein